MAEANGSRTHRRRRKTPPAGFEDRDDHRTACASPCFLCRFLRLTVPLAIDSRPALRYGATLQPYFLSEGLHDHAKNIPQRVSRFSGSRFAREHRLPGSNTTIPPGVAPRASAFAPLCPG